MNIVKCQYCTNEMSRSKKRKKATCWECRIFKVKMNNYLKNETNRTSNQRTETCLS